jgi:hypothetical protein
MLGAAAVVVVGVIIAAVALGGGSAEQDRKAKQRELTNRKDGLPDYQQVTARVEKLRGLRFEQKPRIRLVSSKNLDGVLKRVDAEARAALRGAGKERAEALAAASELLTVQAGVIPEEAFERQNKDEDTSGILGLYVPERRAVYVVRELVQRRPREAEAVLAHELAHALEDQAFGGFEREPKPFADSAFARHALHEGSATLTEVQYRMAHLGSEGPADDVIAGVRDQLTDPKAPPGLNVLSSFPYADGAAFAAALHRKGGWRAVDKAHDDPPKTTSAVLNPERWPRDRHERPRFSLDGALGDDWVRLGRADVGAIDTLAMLRAGLPEREARRAAEGWEAGRFEAWAQQSISRDCKPPCRDQTAAAVVWKFGDEGAQRRFTAAMRASLGKATNARPAGAGALTIGKGAAAQVARGRVSALAFAPSRRQAQRMAEVALR